MLLPVEWIKEYAPVEATADEIAQRLTMAGLEVEETADSPLGPVLNVTVTPNRGDCLSVIGVARELAAAYGVPLITAKYPRSDTSDLVDVRTSVIIESPELCPRYAARIIRNVQHGESPTWMRARLEAAGMRPVGAVVDVTNYVMLETGQPLHAFDYDLLADHRIVVRRAWARETLQTLDGLERALPPNTLVIADAEKAVAVAGVMGGADSEVTSATRTVLLESAHFAPLSIRRTARAIGLRTEASYRFERVVDPNGVVAAADRACALMADLGIGEVVAGVVDVYPEAIEPRLLFVRPGRVSLLLGFPVSEDQARRTLAQLGFTESQHPRAPEGPNRAAAPGPTSSLAFAVPTWRPDIQREVDLAEEVGRVLGYEHIPERLPSGPTLQGGDSEPARFEARVRDQLASEGLQEIMAHSLVAAGPFEDPRTASQRVEIRSALSAELSGLRRSLLPGLLDALDRNARRGQLPLSIFEVGKVFSDEGARYTEETMAAAALCGPLWEPSWQRAVPPPPGDFYTAKGLVERLFVGLHVPGLAFGPSDDPRLHPGRSAAVLCGGSPIGLVGEIHPGLATDLHVRERVLVLEVSVEALRSSAKERALFAAVSPYPAVSRDLAPRLPVSVPYKCIHAAVETAAIPILEQLELTDVFSGPPIPEGYRSLTLSFTFRAQDRTLLDDEVTTAMAKLRVALETSCGASFVS